MKLIFTPKQTLLRQVLAITIVFFCMMNRSNAQICSDPAGVIYGLASNGAIYPITVSNASVGSTVKSSSYSGNSPSSSNGLGYNAANGKFYYFKRDVNSSPQEFVSFDPGTNTVTILATSTCSNTVHTGCVTADGKSYYTFDVDGNLNYYNIITNTWTFITSSIKDQFGANVTTVIQNENAGDIAFDGNGNLWIVTSSTSKYGLYQLPKPMPTTAKAALVVNKLIDPNTATPSGNSIAGIAFNPSGQIFLGTIGDDKLYRLENNKSTTFLGNFSVAGVGNDLTSCAFPLNVLPVKWVSFDATLMNNDRVELNWTAVEDNLPAYDIEYSQDGITWKVLTSIQSTGQSSESRHYVYSHYGPSSGTNYYRIRMQDQLHNQSYSDIKLVDLKTKNAGISIWPNPAGDQIRVNGDFEKQNAAFTVKIYDMAGKVRMEKQLEAGTQTLNISSLKTGMYILNLVSSAGNAYNQKFLKQ